MDFLVLIAVILIVSVIIAIVAAMAESEKVSAMAPEERESYLQARQESLLNMQHGQLNSAMICPHCQSQGKIRTKVVDRKKGVSGGKATAALLTGGVSMFATGLSRKERLTQAHCSNCGNSWEF